MATKKEELSKWRNLTKRNLQKRQEAVNNLLSSLPSGVKSLSDDERAKLLQIRSLYNDILCEIFCFLDFQIYMYYILHFTICWYTSS